MPTPTINVWCDGSITGSHWAPKGQKDTLPHAWSGWVAKTPEGEVIHHDSLDLGEREYFSANVSEYMAVRAALYWLRLHGRTDAAVRIHSDSQLVMRQLTGQYNCNVPRLQILRDAVLKLAADFPRVTYHWIRREENKEADHLSKALQTFGYVPTWQELLDSMACPL